MPAGGESQFVTNDLSLAAFLSMRGVPLSSAGKDERTGIYVFKFRDRQEKCEDLKVDYANSCCAQFEAAVKRLKGILHSGNPNRIKRQT